MNRGRGWLLPVIVDLAKLGRAHPQIAGHLHLSGVKLVAFLGVEPRLHLLVWFPLGLCAADMGVVCDGQELSITHLNVCSFQLKKVWR